MNQKPFLLIIIGPTAVGKTKLSVELAHKLNGEIISADSMQVYHGMNIGTAKPSKIEMQGIPHHLLGIISPSKSFNVVNYVQKAETCINNIWQRHKLPIVTGGTGLYINALIYGFLFPEEGVNLSIRKDLYKKAQQDKTNLHNELTAVDPKAASKLHPNDTRRVIRALEVYHTTGKPISELQKKMENKDANYDTLIFGLTRNRNELYRRIEKRVDLMIENGLIEEARKLLELYPDQPTALQALGYKEIVYYLNNIITLKEAIHLIKRDTRRYAKRQLSWFRRDKNIQWFNLSDENESDIVNKIVNNCRKSIPKQVN